ncbi:hypothetical protein AAHA92_05709 [Salvia divinorum]
MKVKKASSNVRVVAEMVETCPVKDATPRGKKKSQKLSDKKTMKSQPARGDAESIVSTLTNEIEDTIPNREPSKTNLLKQSKKKRKNVESISHFLMNPTTKKMHLKSVMILYLENNFQFLEELVRVMPLGTPKKG